MAQEEARSGAAKHQESQSRKSAKGPRSSGGSKESQASHFSFHPCLSVRNSFSILEIPLSRVKATYYKPQC